MPSCSQGRAKAALHGLSVAELPPTHPVGALVAEDFDCIARDLDVKLIALDRCITGYLVRIQLMEEIHGLTDVWRDQHLGETAIAHVCTLDRLGRWL